MTSHYPNDLSSSLDMCVYLFIVHHSFRRSNDFDNASGHFQELLQYYQESNPKSLADHQRAIVMFNILVFAINRLNAKPIFWPGPFSS